jgi:hypothetical protein
MTMTTTHQSLILMVQKPLVVLSLTYKYPFVSNYLSRDQVHFKKQILEKYLKVYTHLHSAICMNMYKRKNKQ